MAFDANELKGLKELIESGTLDNLSDAQLTELAESVELLRTKTFKDYVPMPHQREFHVSPAHIRLLIGGNRSGKTCAAFHDVMWELTGEYPDWYPTELRLVPPVYTRWIATDFKNGVGAVFQPYFDQLLPKSHIARVVKTQQGILQKAFFKNGSVLDILTDEQDLAVFEGWHGHRLHIDEPCARDRYIASARGLIDYSGRVSFSLTPLKEPWIYDELYEKADGKNIFQVTVSMRENKYLPSAEIDLFEQGLTDDEKEARMHGKFMHLSGLVYKEFDRRLHVIEPFGIPRNWRRVCVLDPHDRKPHAVIWAAVDPFDVLYVYEDMECGGTVQELSNAIKKREGRNQIHLRIIDPNKGKAPSAMGKSGKLTDEFVRYGLHFWAGCNDDLVEGHLEVKRYLKAGGNNNRPQIFFFNNCAQAIKGMTHYVWDDHKTGIQKDVKEKPKDLYKDFPDLVRYLCVSKPTYKQAPRRGNYQSNNPTGY